MSDFHDALRREAQRHGEAVASRLAADAVVASSVHGIARGRRRRATAQAGVGALGAVAIGVAGWLALPLVGVWESEPATPDDSVNAGPWRYSVDSDTDVREGDPEVLLRGENAVTCGDELSLEPGVTVHDPAAFDRALWVEAGLTSRAELFPPRYVDYTPPTEEEAWSEEPLWNVAIGGEARSIEAIPLLSEGATVVGIGQGLSGTSQGDGDGGWGVGGMRVPGVGQCDGSWDGRNGEPGGPLDSLIVAQWWAASEDVTETGGTLLATIVIDPNEPANFTEAPSTDDYSPQPELSSSPAPDDATADPVSSADLRDPEGSMHQAFIVERPQRGCAPLADVLAAGEPSVERAEYTVDVPGLAQTLTGELWGGEPVVTLAEVEEPWYLGLDAWIVADERSVAENDPHLEWTSLSVGGWALAAGGDNPLRDPECVYGLPMPQISGAVFLVIDGVDWDASGIQVQPGAPVDDFQTWVYLGEAN